METAPRLLNTYPGLPVNCSGYRATWWGEPVLNSHHNSNHETTTFISFIIIKNIQLTSCRTPKPSS